MVHFIPDDLRQYYRSFGRGEQDIRVKICVSFQKSMFCVTNAAIWGLAPSPLNSDNSQEQATNRAYFQQWIKRLMTSQLPQVQEHCPS
jgi:hypothetical protein